MAAFGTMYYIPIYLQLRGNDPTHAGLRFIPQPGLSLRRKLLISEDGNGNSLCRFLGGVLPVVLASLPDGVSGKLRLAMSHRGGVNTWLTKLLVVTWQGPSAQQVGRPTGGLESAVRLIPGSTNDQLPLVLSKCCRISRLIENFETRMPIRIVKRVASY